MKKLIIILTIVLSGYSNIYSQWELVYHFPGGTMNDFADNGSILYAAVIGKGIYRSTNNGDNWFLPNSSLHQYNINAIVAKDSYVFVATDTGLFKSTDYGINWSYIDLSSMSVISIPSMTLVNSNNTDYLFVGGIMTILKSSDWGVNWTNAGNGLPEISDIEALSNTNGIIYAQINTYSSVPSGIYKTSNLGINWIFLTQGFQVEARSIFSLDNLILCGGNLLLISTNAGNNWRIIPEIHNVYRIYGFEAFNAKDIFISYWYFGFFVSNDSGKTWNLKNEGLPYLSVYALHRLGEYLYLYDYSYPAIFRRRLSEVIGVKNISTEVPNSTRLYQNYPNPFNSVTKIKYQISKMSSPHALGGELVSLKIYNILGKEVATLVNEKQKAGVYEVTFDAGKLTTGIYFYKIQAGDFVQVKRMVLVK